MSLWWDYANWFAWIASFVLFLIIAIDLWKVEQSRKRNRNRDEKTNKLMKGGGR